MAAIHSFAFGKSAILALIFVGFGHVVARNVASFPKQTLSANEARLADLSLFPDDRADFFLLDCKTQTNSISKKICTKLVK